MALLVERGLLLGLGGWLGVWLWQRWVWQKQRQKLETVFYDLLLCQRGKITLMQLVAHSRVEPKIVQEFLTEKARFLGAVMDTDNQGYDYYQFPPI